MDRDKWFRRVLWYAVIFNLAGACLFAFPSSSIGRLAGLPSPVPQAYSAMLAYFVVLFGGMYAWLALQPNIPRQLVAFAAIGKTGAFLTVLATWHFGQIPGRAVVAAAGDLAFAAIFAGWLLANPKSVPPPN